MISKWTPSLRECSMVAQHVLEKKIKEEWMRIRLKSDVHAAKRAAILLPSEASRIFDVLMLVGDFLLCVVSLIQEAASIIEAIESDSDARLSELKNIAKSQKHNMSDTLDLVVKYMLSAEAEEQISNYRSKCFDKLKSVEEGIQIVCNHMHCLAQSAIHTAGMSLVKALPTKKTIAINMYKEKICNFLGVLIRDKPSKTKGKNHYTKAFLSKASNIDSDDLLDEKLADFKFPEVYNELGIISFLVSHHRLQNFWLVKYWTFMALRQFFPTRVKRSLFTTTRRVSSVTRIPKRT